MNRLAKFTEIELIDALKCLIERVKVLIGLQFRLGSMF